MEKKEKQEEQPLNRLAELYGIATGYCDARGTLRNVPSSTLRRLLRAMGVRADSDRDVERLLTSAMDERWRRRLEPVCVGWEGDASLSLKVASPEAERGRTLRWRLTEESGAVASGTVKPAELPVRERRQVGGKPWVSTTMSIPAPGSTGYHRFRLEEDAAPDVPLAECLVIFAPASCYRPEPVAAGQRLWGLTAQLYALRSQRNWGIGDFTDLMRLVEFAADNGAGFVGLNPLHSPLSHDNEHASPYDPSSRRFLNTLYLDVEAIPDFAESAAAGELVSDETFQAELRRLRAAELIDYRAIGAAKNRVLHLLYASFCRRHKDRDTPRGKRFRAFRHDQGEALHRYASFEVVREHWYGRDSSAWGWPAWPAEYRDHRSQAVRTLVAAHRERLEFFMYTQWIAEQQLAAAADRARELGMAVGIYADLPLSANPGGADTWSDRDLYMSDARLGAPPDDFNQAGQEWGLPPVLPAALREAAYRPFVETLRANMRIGGALRMDHVMSLMRCFLIPPDSRPADGAYVHYPFDELRAILALESRRNRCLVIGEDLGTVPDGVRRGLSGIGVLGYRVLYFEKQEDGAFRAPEDFDADVLTVISTHDLPTLTGFWQGADIEWRTEHNLFPGDREREQQIVTRAEDRARLLMALEKQELLPAEFVSTELQAGAEMTPALRRAFHRYLARTASVLAGVQAEDLLGDREQANLPGTTREHPNWRRRLSLQLEGWAEEPEVVALLSDMREERPEAREQPPAPRASPPRRPNIPRATYRVQLHKGFGFADLERLVPYLDALGISHVYCSPYLKARPGSDHGYDVIDHGSLNPEIGDEADLDNLCETLARHGMGHILDMVPNHMAVTGGDHEWWLDILANGPASRYADFFDIDWQPLKEELRGKVLLPVLGDHYGNVLDNGQLKLDFDPLQGSFSVHYFEHRFSIDPRTYPQILETHLDVLRNRLPEDDTSLVLFESLITAFGNLPSRTRTDEESKRERARDRTLHQQQLVQLVADAPDIRHYIADALRTFNGDEDYPADIARLHLLLEAQPYRLAYWRVASHEINYRRFFDINDLASLRMENQDVFEATHGLVFDLIASGKLQGLRIDHPDGLYDPRAYFRAVQERVGPLPADTRGGSGELPLYLLAEKILAAGEELRDDWLIHGTTGYEFANLVNRFLVRGQGLDGMDAALRAFIGRDVTYDETLHRSKQLIMQTALASELNVLTAELDRLAEQDPHTRDFGLGGLKNALLETVACFPVYRTYTVDGEVSRADAAIINAAVDTARSASEAADTSVFEFLRDVILNRSAAGRSEILRSRVARFGMRLQQYTSPVAAKGMEDTAFYRYARLISLNEVGGTPEEPDASTAEFHEANAERLANWPHSMLTSSTHDAKRSEDVRARLHVLSEIPSEWRQHVETWASINASCKPAGEAAAQLDPDAEYFLYQTLVGAWPPGPDAMDERELDEFAERIKAYMIKAAKEAKRRTSWLNPDPLYESALQHFIEALLDPATNTAFAESFLPFQRRVARLGLWNSLSQLLLKLACPGVPDVYQGNELWRFDLVDPDNRRPVDFEQRQAWLADLRHDFDEGRGNALVRQLMHKADDGGIKLYVTWRALSVRREHPEVFECGDYRPLAVTGDRAAHVCAFSRSDGRVTVVVAVLKWFAELVDSEGVRLDAVRLAQTSVELPPGPLSWVDSMTGGDVDIGRKDGASRVLASELFAELPVAMLVSR